MQSRNTRGVQQEDVWSAADALIALGLRPTIERVRQKIGRGSPNTVSPMLESWFATLSSRLGVSNKTEEITHIPGALQQAMEKLWDMALTNGREEADEKISQARQTLTEATEALRVRENKLVQHEQVLAARHAALEEALHAAVNKAEDLVSRLNQMQALTGRREMEIETLRSRLAVVEDEREADRRRSSEETSQHAVERRRYEERSEAAQRKLLEEIDRVRQEAKKMRVDAQMSEKRVEADRSSLQQKIRSQEADLSRVQELAASQTAELNGLRQALAVSNFRSDELRNLLEKHQMGSEIAIARLTEALSAHGSRQAAGVKLQVRKVKRPMRIR